MSDVFDLDSEIIVGVRKATDELLAQLERTGTATNELVNIRASIQSGVDAMSQTGTAVVQFTESITVLTATLARLNPDDIQSRLVNIDAAAHKLLESEKSGFKQVLEETEAIRHEVERASEENVKELKTIAGQTDSIMKAVSDWLSAFESEVKGGLETISSDQKSAARDSRDSAAECRQSIDTIRRRQNSIIALAVLSVLAATASATLVFLQVFRVIS
jgi:hypothetical protein